MLYRPSVDGLRAVAVVPVVLFHAGFSAFGGGFVGVDVFFAISGYLITSQIISEMDSGAFSLAAFYERRARRILPAMFFVMLACLPAAWVWLLAGEMKEFSESLVAAATFTSNILFWRQTGYFEAAAELKPLIHFWSLAVEEQYYIFFPLFLIALSRTRRNKVVGLIAVVALTSFALAQWGSVHRTTAAFFLLPTRGWELLSGGALAVTYGKLDYLRRTPGFGEFASAAGLSLVLFAVFAFDKNTPSPSVHTLVPIVGTILLLSFATDKTLVGRTLGSPILAGLGLISYSTYLWHQPLFAFARLETANQPGTPLLLSLSVAAVVLAYFSWKYVETPFRQRDRVGRRQIAAYGLSAAAAFIAFGTLGTITAGFSHRFSEADRPLAELQFGVEGEYVKARFDGRVLADFDESAARTKVLIVGDSYAQDLVNAVYESDFFNHIQVSTRHLGTVCGILFVPSDGRLAAVAKPSACTPLYEDKALRRLMLDADEIWFAANWPLWQVDFILESVQNAKEFSQKTVRVFGRKQFGSFGIRQLLSLDRDQRLALRVPVDKEAIQTNSAMKGLLGDSVFIDIEEILCRGALPLCPLFTEGGELISHDTAHLTPAGAKYLGDKLAALPQLSPLLGAK